MPTAYCLLPTAYCLLPTAYCLLPTAYCLLPAAYCLLPAACCLLPTAYCLLPTAAYCLLPTAYCLLPTAYSTAAEPATRTCFSTCYLIHTSTRTRGRARTYYLVPTRCYIATHYFSTKVQNQQNELTNPHPSPNAAMLGRVPPKGLIYIFIKLSSETSWTVV